LSLLMASVSSKFFAPLILFVSRRLPEVGRALEKPTSQRSALGLISKVRLPKGVLIRPPLPATVWLERAAGTSKTPARPSRRAAANWVRNAGSATALSGAAGSVGARGANSKAAGADAVAADGVGRAEGSGGGVTPTRSAKAGLRDNNSGWAAISPASETYFSRRRAERLLASPRLR
jgi:hypothetical protein